MDAVHNFLVNNATVATKVGTDTYGDVKVYFEEAPKGVRHPFILLSQIDDLVNDTKNTASKLDQVRIQVLCYGDEFFDNGSVVGSKSLANVVRSQLDHTTWTYAGNEQFARLDDEDTFQDNLTNKPSKVTEHIYEVYKKR